MISFVLKYLYLPYRFIFILAVAIYTSVPFFVLRIFGMGKRYPLGVFYRTLFQRLGGTFIKVGQSLSIRHDYLAPEHCEALSDLLDRVPQFSSRRGIAIIEKELGKSIDELFSEIDPEPVAAASFSQVYKALDKEGNELAIKVKRPYMWLVVFADTWFMRMGVSISMMMGFGWKLGVGRLVKELIEVLHTELDYERELQHLQVQYAVAEKLDYLHVPKVYSAYSTNRILSMEFLNGTSLRDILTRIRETGDRQQKDIYGNPINLQDISHRIFQGMMYSIFDAGIFHGDPHPGNILIMPDGKIGLIDFGIMGIQSDKMRIKNLEYFKELSEANYERAANIFVSMLKPRPEAEFDSMRTAVNLNLRIYLSMIENPELNFSQKSSSFLYLESMNLARKYGFSLPHNVLLYNKALFTIDHTLLELDEKYNSRTAITDFLMGYSMRTIELKLSKEASPAAMFETMENILDIKSTMSELNLYIKTLRASAQKEKSTLWKAVRDLSKISSDFCYLGALALPLFTFAFPLAFLEGLSPIFVTFMVTGFLLTGNWLRRLFG